jgi:glucose-1-phosphate thymidylyltransferase
LENGSLNVKVLGRGYSWMDAGTFDALSEASEFIRVVQTRQGIVIASPEEIARLNGWVDLETLARAAQKYGSSPYGAYLKKICENKIIYKKG